MRIIGEQQDGTRLGALAQKMKHSHRDQIGARRRLVTETKSGPNRLAIGLGQSADLMEDRSNQLVEPGEGKLRLGLDTGGRQNLESLGSGMHLGRVEQ